MGDRFDTQDKLIAATRQIIIEEGVEATSLEHICKVAGFTRGAFYSNFSSKDSLLAALAEDEYAELIRRLRATVEAWAQRSDISPDQPLLIENLLFEALDAVGVDTALFVIHSELLTRSVRDSEWGSRLLDINVQFVDELGRVLTWILEAAGRRLTFPLRAMTHAIIGIVMRAAGVAAWRASAMHQMARMQAAGQPIPPSQAAATARALSNDTPPQHPADSHDTEAQTSSNETVTGPTKESPTSAGKHQGGSLTENQSGVRDSAAAEVLEVILQVLYSSSEPA